MFQKLQMEGAQSNSRLLPLPRFWTINGTIGSFPSHFNIRIHWMLQQPYKTTRCAEVKSSYALESYRSICHRKWVPSQLQKIQGQLQQNYGVFVLIKPCSIDIKDPGISSVLLLLVDMVCGPEVFATLSLKQTNIELMGCQRLQPFT